LILPHTPPRGGRKNMTEKAFGEKYEKSVKKRRKKKKKRKIE
jgi:hypothetical protein